MKHIRSIIRKQIIQEYALDGARSVFPTNDKGNFPYGGDSHRINPQHIDPMADYLWNWQQLASNNDVYEFPTTEFNLGLQIEKQRNSEMNVLEIAEKVIKQLKSDTQFYSKLRERSMYGGAGS